MNIELANGSEGYIPPPEQHALGRLHHLAGPHRRAGGPGRAEDRRGRAGAARAGRGQAAARRCRSPTTPYAEAVLASKPMAYWRLDEIEGTVAARFQRPRPRRRVRGRRRAATCRAPDAPGLSAPAADQSRRPSRRGPPQGPARPPAGDLHRRALVLERLAGADVLGPGNTSLWCATAGRSRSTSTATRSSRRHFAVPVEGFAERFIGTRDDGGTGIRGPDRRGRPLRPGARCRPRSPRTSARRRGDNY